MPIDRISSLRAFGVFRDSAWPRDLPDFTRYNLIYGWNGSGKSTLSRLLRALEHRTPPSLGQATIRIDGADVNGESFARATLPVRVFNRDYVAESVFPVGGGDVRPIFVVGRENVEKQKEVARLKAARATAESSLGAARSSQQEAERAFDRFCQDKARAIKDELRSPGPNPYNNYDKSNFKDRAGKLASEGDFALHRLTADTRNSNIKQIRSSSKPRVQEVTYPLPALQPLADSAARLLSTSVVSEAIQALKDDPRLAEWVRQGVGLHRDPALDTCLFCKQPLQPERLRALEAHFNAEYEQFLRELDAQVARLRTATGAAPEPALPRRAELYDDLGQEYADAEVALRRVRESMLAFQQDVLRVLTDKRARPFDRIAFDIKVPALDTQIVDRLNALIRRHNQTCEEFNARVAAARDLLAFDMIAEALDEFAQLRTSVEDSHGKVQLNEKEVQRLTTEIERLEREIVEHRPPAEQLNDELRTYLGHGELQLAIKETGYAITRAGEPARGLSEGEITGIALLYFLKSLDDRGFDRTRGVVVLDDPVSSLDQNALFAAFGYIRARAQGVGQILILTHNFMFFRLLREWFRNLRGPDKRKWRIYMLECDHEGSCRTARIRAIDSLLMDFDSEYHYLFSCVHRMAVAPRAGTLESYYHAPSIARRVLETFLAFRVPDLGGHHQLWQQMQTIPFDDAKRSRIYRFVQTHSHRDVVGDPDEDMTLLGESQAVLDDLLALMQAADPDHVGRMISRLSSATDAGGDDGAAGGA